MSAADTTRPTELPRHHATKQLLDELDALMERMLTLPVEEPEPLPAIAPVEQGPPEAAAMLTLVEPSPESPEPPATENTPPVSYEAPFHEPAVEYELPQVDAKLAEPSPVKQMETDAGEGPGGEEGRGELAAPAVREPNYEFLFSPAPVDSPLPPLPEPPPTPPLFAARRTWQRRAIRLVWRGLLTVNQSFDRATSRLGVWGRWLRSSPGRAVLGLVGVALLTFSLLWWLL